MTDKEYTNRINDLRAAIRRADALNRSTARLYQTMNDTTCLKLAQEQNRRES